MYHWPPPHAHLVHTAMHRCALVLVIALAFGGSLIDATAAPTAEPTAAPSAAPTAAPSAAPTAAPSAQPSAAPSAAPTSNPTPSATAVQLMPLLAYSHPTAVFSTTNEGYASGGAPLRFDTRIRTSAPDMCPDSPTRFVVRERFQLLRTDGISDSVPFQDIVPITFTRNASLVNETMVHKERNLYICVPITGWVPSHLHAACAATTRAARPPRINNRLAWLEADVCTVGYYQIMDPVIDDECWNNNRICHNCYPRPQSTSSTDNYKGCSCSEDRSGVLIANGLTVAMSWLAFAFVAAVAVLFYYQDFHQGILPMLKNGEHSYTTLEATKKLKRMKLPKHWDGMSIFFVFIALGAIAFSITRFQAVHDDYSSWPTERFSPGYVRDTGTVIISIILTMTTVAIITGGTAITHVLRACGLDIPDGFDNVERTIIAAVWYLFLAYVQLLPLMATSAARDNDFTVLSGVAKTTFVLVPIANGLAFLSQTFRVWTGARNHWIDLFVMALVVTGLVLWLVSLWYVPCEF